MGDFKYIHVPLKPLLVLHSIGHSKSHGQAQPQNGRVGTSYSKACGHRDGEKLGPLMQSRTEVSEGSGHFGMSNPSTLGGRGGRIT